VVIIAQNIRFCKRITARRRKKQKFLEEFEKFEKKGIEIHWGFMYNRKRCGSSSAQLRMLTGNSPWKEK